MKIKSIFSLLFLLFILHGKCFAQTDSLKINSLSADTLHRYTVCFKTTPLTLVDLANGGNANIVAESFLTKRFSVSLEVGAYYRFAGYNMKSVHGWRSGIELRYYFNENPDWDYFFGLRYFNKKMGFTITDSIKTDLVPYAKTYIVHKDVSVVDLVFGKRNFIAGKHFTTEFYGGLGVRFKDTECIGLTKTESDNRVWGDSLFLPLIMQNGNYVHMDLLFGVKIGFGIK